MRPDNTAVSLVLKASSTLLTAPLPEVGLQQEPHAGAAAQGMGVLPSDLLQ